MHASKTTVGLLIVSIALALLCSGLVIAILAKENPGDPAEQSTTTQQGDTAQPQEEPADETNAYDETTTFGVILDEVIKHLIYIDESYMEQNPNNLTLREAVIGWGEVDESNWYAELQPYWLDGGGTTVAVFLHAGNNPLVVVEQRYCGPICGEEIDTYRFDPQTKELTLSNDPNVLQPLLKSEAEDFIAIIQNPQVEADGSISTAILHDLPRLGTRIYLFDQYSNENIGYYDWQGGVFVRTLYTEGRPRD